MELNIEHRETATILDGVARAEGEAELSLNTQGETKR